MADKTASHVTVNEFHYFREQIYTCTGEDQIPSIYDQWADKFNEVSVLLIDAVSSDHALPPCCN